VSCNVEISSSQAVVEGGKFNQDSSDSHHAPAAATQRPRTRLNKGIHRPCVYTCGTICYGMLSIIGEPSNLSDAHLDKN
jgi:hypothetical protein